MIGGSGGNVIHCLGPPAETPDKRLAPEVLLLRKLRRAVGMGNGRPVVVLKGQREIDWTEAGE